MIVLVYSFTDIEARDGCCLSLEFDCVFVDVLVVAGSLCCVAVWYWGEEFFMLAVDSWRFRNMKFMRKCFFIKIFVMRRKMRKNDIEESELNGLIRTYSTVLQDQTRFEKFNKKQWKNDEKIGKNTDQVAEHNVLNYTNTKNDSRVNWIGNNKKKIRWFKSFQAILIGR